MSLSILIPCKSLEAGKSRLASSLAPSSRRELCRNLLMQTLAVAVDFVTPERVWLVSRDSEVLKIGEGYRVGSLLEKSHGLNAALDNARILLAGRLGNPELMIVPIDLPLASKAALTEVAKCDGEVVIAPDKGLSGTNVLLLRPAALRLFHFVYGRGSYKAHVSVAQRLGLSVTTIMDDRLSFDIDEPEDFLIWRTQCFALE